MNVEGPGAWSCSNIQHSIASLDEAETLLYLFKFVDRAGGVPLFMGSQGVVVSYVASCFSHGIESTILGGQKKRKPAGGLFGVGRISAGLQKSH